MKSQSNIDRLKLNSKKQNLSQQLKNYWDIRNTEIALPIYAAGKAYTTGAFEALTIQCFYSNLFAKLIDSIVRGQVYQSSIQINVPPKFFSLTFGTLFRNMLAYNILVIGLYREVTEENRATFPYVQTCPSSETVINEGDKMFVYCHVNATMSILKGGNFATPPSNYRERSSSSIIRNSTNNPIHSK